MRYRTAAVVAGILASATATLALSSPASAGPKEVRLKVTQPATFVAGGPPGTLTATAFTDGSRPGCRKLRWSLVLRVQGVALNQVRVKRIEGAGDFPVAVQAGGNAARITDRKFDTGSLCADKTNTAQYAIAITGSGTGAIAFEIEPLDAAGRILATTASQSTVGARPAPPVASPDPSPSRSEAAVAAPAPAGTDTAETTPPAAAALEPTAGPAAGPAAGSVLEPAAGKAKGNSPSLLGPGLIIGGLLVFVGVGLLLRLQLRNRRNPARERDLPPTSFYPTYPSP